MCTTIYSNEMYYLFVPTRRGMGGMGGVRGSPRKTKTPPTMVGEKRLEKLMMRKRKNPHHRRCPVETCSLDCHCSDLRL